MVKRMDINLQRKERQDKVWKVFLKSSKLKKKKVVVEADVADVATFGHWVMGGEPHRGTINVSHPVINHHCCRHRHGQTCLQTHRHVYRHADRHRQFVINHNGCLNIIVNIFLIVDTLPLLCPMLFIYFQCLTNVGSHPMFKYFRYIFLIADTPHWSVVQPNHYNILLFPFFTYVKYIFTYMYNISFLLQIPPVCLAQS